MADDLKRVGLVFKADGDVDFVKSLKAVNAELRENYQQFQLTQSQWDSKTKTSEKLTAKLNYLNDAYDIQNKKVQQLTIELKELESAENRDETAITKKKTALAQAETQLNKYGKQIDTTTKKIKSGTADIEDFAKNLNATGESLVNAGKKASIFSAAYGAAIGVAVKNAIEFESEMAGVAKTFPGTQEELAKTTDEIREMARSIPATTTEIASVAEAAGQLGISSDNIMSFTRTMIDLGNATNLTAEEGATTLAKFANVTKMSQSQFSNLGSAIVALGNNFATTEADITNMAMNLGSAGSQVGMSQSDILALATALSSVGLEAQAGGTAFSKAMIAMQLAVETGSDDLKDFASVAGMSTSEFSKAFKKDASSALLAFIDGLSKSGKQGKSAIKVLDDMGITETRLRDALLRSANASDIFSDAIALGSTAWEENTALSNEAETRYATTESQIQVLTNTIKDLAISFGTLLLPTVQKMVDGLKKLVDWVNNLNGPTKAVVLIFGALLAAIGPLLIVVGKLAMGISSIITLFVKLMPVFKVIGAAVTAFTGSLGLPIVVIAAIGVAIGSLVYLVIKHWDTIKEFTVNTFNSIKEICLKIFEDLKSWFSGFSSSISSVIENIKKSFSDGINNISSFFKNAFDSIKKFVVNALNSITESLKTFVAKVLQYLNTPIEFVKNAVLLVVALFATMLDKIYKTVIVPLVNFFNTAFQTVYSFVTSTVTNMINFIKTVFENMRTFIVGVLNSVKSWFSTIFSWVSTNVIQPFYSKVRDVFNIMKDFISQMVNTIKNVFSNGFGWIKASVITPLVSFFSNIFNSIMNIINGVIDKIRTAFSNMKSFIVTVFSAVKSTIKTIFESIGNIIKTPINGVIGLINDVLKSLNKIKVPDWVPGVGGKGINFPMIKYLAGGGDLLSGAAIVGEAGPELLMQSAGRSSVVPLTSSGGAAQHDLIDYEKLAAIIMQAVSSINPSIELNDRVLGRFILKTVGDV